MVGTYVSFRGLGVFSFLRIILTLLLAFSLSRALWLEGGEINTFCWGCKYVLRLPGTRLTVASLCF